MKKQDLVANVARMGVYLENLLRNRLGNHPHVGDIRGRGLFWAIEFVADKSTKEPFSAELEVAKRMGGKGLEKGYDISLSQQREQLMGGTAITSCLRLRLRSRKGMWKRLLKGFAKL